VGTDRGLKRLSLARVDDLPLRPAITARVGEPAGPARERILADPFPYLLLTDTLDRPIGWLDQRALPADGPLAADGAIPMSPVFDRRTTLKDALSMLLDADVQAGVLVDRAQRLRGLVTVGMIADWFRAAGGRDLPPELAADEPSAAAAARA
jgi:hypothetical protein